MVTKEDLTLDESITKASEGFEGLIAKVRELDPDKQLDVNRIFTELSNDSVWLRGIGGKYANLSRLDRLKIYAQAYDMVTGQEVNVIVKDQIVALQY